MKVTDRLANEETDSIKERVTCIRDRSTIEKDRLKEISSSVLDTDRQKSLIETDKKESLREKLIDNEKEIIKKGMVKEIKEMFERQNREDVGKVIDIVKQRNMTMKERKDDSLKDDSFRYNDDSLKERIT